MLPLLLVSVSVTASGEWHNYIIDDYGYSATIDLYSSDLPIVVYSRYSPGVKYATFDGASWTTDTLYVIEYGSCIQTSVVVDDGDVPHVSFAPPGVTRYGCMDSTGEWVIDALPPECLDIWNSIALDPEGNPCVSFYNFTSDDLWLACREGTEWVTETVDSEGDTGDCNSLAIDGEGVVHIAYCRYSPDPGVRYAMKDINSQWHLETVDAAMSSDPSGTSLALDAFGNPCISYTASGELRYAARDGSSWNVETVYATDTGPSIYGTSLAMDQFGYPHIVHCSPNADFLLYSVDQGAGWQTDSIAELYGPAAGDPDLVLDELGRPHIIYESWDDDRNLRYVYNDEPSGIAAGDSGEGPLSLSAGPVPFQGRVRLLCTVPEGEEFTLRVFDLSGRLIRDIPSGTPGAGQYQFFWQPDASVPTGQYMVVLQTATDRAARKVIHLR